MSERSPYGWLQDGVHVLPLRVYWEDTDAGGVVYYANYLRFIERGRSDLLRLAGINQQRLQQQTGVVLVVRSCHIDYFRPARLDDELEVHSRLARLQRASVEILQSVMCGGVELVRALVQVACIDAGGRPHRLPEVVREALAVLPLTPVEDSHG